ncbi:MAG: DUF5131 family protein [Aestuariivita sp.]|nr:DUF5131 family protein [Aestuariivita sp.]
MFREAINAVMVVNSLSWFFNCLESLPNREGDRSLAATIDRIPVNISAFNTRRSNHRALCAGVKMRRRSCQYIAWAIVGGESGPRARPMHYEWVTAIREQCDVYGTAFFFKQWGGARPKSGGRELDGFEWNGFPWRIVPDDLLKRSKMGKTHQMAIKKVL